MDQRSVKWTEASWNDEIKERFLDFLTTIQESVKRGDIRVRHWQVKTDESMPVADRHGFVKRVPSRFSTVEFQIERKMEEGDKG